MGYIVLSKKQVAGNNINGSLNVKLCKDKASANLQRKQLHEKNYDVVILDKTDCDLLSKSTFKDWVYGGYNNPDPIWNGPSEDLLVNSSEGDDMNSDKHNDEHTGEDNLYPELTLSQAKDLVGHNFGWGGDEEDNDGGDDTNSDKHNEIYKHNYGGDELYPELTLSQAKDLVGHNFGWGGDEEAHKAWDKEGEGKVIEHDVVILSKGDETFINAFGDDEQVDLGPQRFYADEDGDEYYLSSNGNRYYLFKKMVTLKGDRAHTIYTFGKKEWSRTNDLTLLRFYNIPYDKCVVENSSGYPFLKTEVALNEQIEKTPTWDL